MKIRTGMSEVRVSHRRPDIPVRVLSVDALTRFDGLLDRFDGVVLVVA